MFGQRAGVRADPGAAEEQVLRGAGHVRGAVLVRDAIVAALLAQMFAQQLTSAGIEYTHRAVVPLSLNLTADPSWRGAVISRFDLNAAIQVDPSVSELIVAEGFDREREQGRLLLGEYGCHLTFGGAVDAGVGPVLLPAVEVGLGVCQALEAQAPCRA